MNENAPDLLDEYTPETDYVYASLGARFANGLIDFAGFCVLHALFVLFLFWNSGRPMVLPFPWLWFVVLMPTGIQLFLLYGYYFIFEALTGGRSLGKLITGTVAIKDDGSPITFKEAFLRSLCRAIPFEALTLLTGMPWHDKFTKTLVAKKR